jgi:hypothetical protein
MLRERFTETLKTAMKDRDQARVSAVRLIIARLKERDIEARAKGNAAWIEATDRGGETLGVVGLRRFEVATDFATEFNARRIMYANPERDAPRGEIWHASAPSQARCMSRSCRSGLSRQIIAGSMWRSPY